MFNIFKSKKDKSKEDKKSLNINKSIIIDSIKHGVLIMGLIYISYVLIINKLEPEKIENQNFLVLSNVVREPNMNESVFDDFEKNAPKYLLNRNVVLGSNFTPFYKWLTIPQIEVLRKFTLFYVMKYIEEDKNNQFFTFDYEKINITNITKFKTGEYNNGVIVQFPISQYQGNDTKYIYYYNMGEYHINATINNLDEINSINLLQTQINDLYLVCKKLEVKDQEYSFTDCKTEYGAGVEYFTNNWKNINNLPNVVKLKTRLFYEYYALSMQGLTNDSSCYDNYSIIEYNIFFMNCEKDINQAINNINEFGNGKKYDYLNYSRKVSSSLKIKTEDLSPELGFVSVGYKYKAIRMLLDKYAPSYSYDELWMVTKIVNEKWNPEYPQIVVDLANYSQQDIYNIKNARQISKDLTKKNLELEKQEKAKVKQNT